MHTCHNLSSALLMLGGGLLLVSVGLAARHLINFCRHKKMGWPIRQDGCTYQVCLDCGIKRLFDEGRFQPYGRYSHDLTHTGAT